MRLHKELKLNHSRYIHIYYVCTIYYIMQCFEEVAKLQEVLYIIIYIYCLEIQTPHGDILLTSAIEFQSPP